MRLCAQALRDRARARGGRARRRARRSCGFRRAGSSSAHPTPSSGTRCRAGRRRRRACLPASASATARTRGARNSSRPASTRSQLRLREFRVQRWLPAPRASRRVPPCRCRVRWSRPALAPSAVSTRLQRMRSPCTACAIARGRHAEFRGAAFVHARRRTVAGVVQRAADVVAVAQRGFQRAELALREVLRRAEAEARGELALQVRGAQADRVGERVQRGLAAVEQRGGRVRASRIVVVVTGVWAASVAMCMSMRETIRAPVGARYPILGAVSGPNQAPVRRYSDQWPIVARSRQHLLRQLAVAVEQRRARRRGSRPIRAAAGPDASRPASRAWRLRRCCARWPAGRRRRVVGAADPAAGPAPCARPGAACAWLRSWSRSARRSASLSETDFLARSARNCATSCDHHWNSLSLATRAVVQRIEARQQRREVAVLRVRRPRRCCVHGSALS